MTKLNPLIDAGAIKAKGYAEGYSTFMNLALGPKTDTAVSAVAKPDPRYNEIAKTMFFDQKEKKLSDDIKLQLEGLSESERKRFLRKMILKHERELVVVRAERARKEAIIASGRKTVAACEDVLKHFNESFVLEKVDDSCFAKFRKSLLTGHAHCYSKSMEEDYPGQDYEQEVLQQAEIFVVQHDWAAALSSAKDLESAPFCLPYEVCAFEFQFSGRRVIALATDIEGRVVFTPIFETPLGWLMLNFIYDCDDGLPSIGDGYSIQWAPAIGAQIRAICISLDAEIAKTEVQREPHSGIESKNSHAPLKKFHIVSLLRKPRALSAGNHAGSMTGTKRLHFRRGHWRHFATFKTWVKWCLCGNPDLGFIDKQYRL